MSEIAHATLQRLRRMSRPGKNKPVTVRLEGPELSVQFNPGSLKISRNNNVDRGGVTAGTQKRHHPAQEASTLSFDLEFDTAEQGQSGRHVDVRDWTAIIRQFVEPPPDNPAGPPPAVRFAWGTLVFDGIIQQVTEDLELFAADGTPLRAKVGVSISEQNFRYEAKKDGAGAKDDKAASDPGAPPKGAAPGSGGSGQPDRLVLAQAGESAQQLMARLGLDPSAWRAAMTGLDSPLSLPAGTPVQLGAEISASPAPGAAAGFAADPAVTSAAALNAALSADAAAGTQAGGAASQAGFALAAAGGMVAAARKVAAAQVAGETAAARATFAVPGTVAVTAGSEPTSAVADARALTYGRQIPLRARAHASTLAASGAERSVAARARRSEVPVATSAAAPWEQLPRSDGTPPEGTAGQRRRDAGRCTLCTKRGGVT